MPLPAIRHRSGIVLPLLLLAAPSIAADAPAAPEPRGIVTGFPDWVTSLAFSPDGASLAAGTYDEVRLIDPATRQAIATLETGNGYARSLSFSPDGSQLAVGDYQSISLWDPKAAHRRKTLSGHTGYVTTVAFAGDRLVSGSEDGTVRIWDFASGESLRTIDVGIPVNDVAVSPDGALLAVAAGDPTRPNRPGSVTLWDLASGEKIADLVGHERAALAVAFAPDGARLASAGEDEKVNLHDVATRKAVGYYAGHSRSVNDVAFLAGCLASVSGGNAGGLCEFRVWKSDGTDLAAIEPHAERITALALSPNGRLLALASHDKTVSLWDVGVVFAGAARSPIEAPRP